MCAGIASGLLQSPALLNFLLVFVVTLSALSVVSFLHTTSTLDLASLETSTVLVPCQRLEDHFGSSPVHSIGNEASRNYDSDAAGIGISTGISPWNSFDTFEFAKVRLGQRVLLRERAGGLWRDVRREELSLSTGKAWVYSKGNHKCSGDFYDETESRQRRKLTVVLAAKGHYCPNRRNTRLVEFVRRLLLPAWTKRLEIDKLLISWSPAAGGQALGAATILHDLGLSTGVKRAAVEVVVHEEKHLLNKFAAAELACTDWILHLDAEEVDESLLGGLEQGFLISRRFVGDRIAGFTCHGDHACELVSTAAAFLHSKYHKEVFRQATLLNLRLAGNQRVTSSKEADMLVNYAVAQALSRSSSQRALLKVNTTSYSILGYAVKLRAEPCEWTVQRIPFGNADVLHSNGPWKLAVALNTKSSGMVPEVCLNASTKQGFDLEMVRGSSEDGFQRNYALLHRSKSHALPCVHVLVPFGDNAGPLELARAVESVFRQGYVKKVLWLVADGSQANSFLSQICGASLGINASHSIHSIGHFITPIVCLLSKPRHEKSKGSAYAKYLGFRKIQEKLFIDPKDIILVLDGDDYLLGHHAIDLVVEEYRRKDCWFSWGGMVGLYAEQGAPLQPSDGIVLSPRQSKWVFTHPRTLKVALAAHLQPSDFQNRSGKWVRKATDVGFIYRMVELAGPLHACYIEGKIYQYTANKRPKSLDAVSPEEKESILRHFKGMKPSKPLTSLTAW